MPDDPSPWRTADASADVLPDFLLLGAMKSGTTSMNHLLASHPDVFMPIGELFFFTRDDIEQHPNQFFQAGDEWTFRDMEENLEAYLRSYREEFRSARDDQLVGEGSTTYLPSKKAPGRIRKLLPDAKLVAMLRDPVDRAYSHYWHIVRKGLAMFDFETTLERCPGQILNRSFYREQIERYLRSFPREQLKVIVFERFVRQPQTVVDELCEFLDLDREIDVESVEFHQNPGGVPVFASLNLVKNRIFRRRIDQTDARNSLQNLPDAPSWWRVQARRGLKGLASALVRNRAVSKLERVLGSNDYPPMAPETRTFLERLFWKENRGLGDRIGRDLGEYWPYFDGGP